MTNPVETIVSTHLVYKFIAVLTGTRHLPLGTLMKGSEN